MSPNVFGECLVTSSLHSSHQRLVQRFQKIRFHSVRTSVIQTCSSIYSNTAAMQYSATRRSTQRAGGTPPHWTARSRRSAMNARRILYCRRCTSCCCVSTSNLHQRSRARKLLTITQLRLVSSVGAHMEPPSGAAARLAQPGANAAPERAARQVLSLLSLERQGLHTKLIEGRASLREKNARLFECQM